jgi:hypothetical protein
VREDSNLRPPEPIQIRSPQGTKSDIPLGVIQNSGTRRELRQRDPMYEGLQHRPHVACAFSVPHPEVTSLAAALRH